MNSLNDLNNYGIEVTYTDERDPFVEFDRTTAENQTQIVNEGLGIAASLGIEILDIIGFSTALVNYTIDVSATPGTTVTWTTVPPTCTVTNPSTGVYRISGINSKAIWDQVKQPIIQPPADYISSFNYTSTINYLTSLNKSWTTNLTVVDVEEWSSTSLSDFYFTPGSENTINTAPTLIDVGVPNPTWIVTITPSNLSYLSSMSSTGTGGSSSFNATTKVLTINGTNDQINSHLQNLKLTSIADLEYDFALTYKATNIAYGYSDQVTQNMRSTLIRYLGRVRSNQVFAEDDPQFSLGSSTPLIIDLEYTGSGSYTMVIEAVPTTAVSTLSSSGTGGTSSWNNSTKRLTITGTKAQVNSHLNAVNILIAPDYAVDFYLYYQLTTPNAFTQNKNQVFDNVAVHPEVININLIRQYVPGTDTLIFATNSPSITDLDPVTNFTITLTTTKGVFSAVGTTTSANWTYTGTKNQINDLFPQIKFTPNSGIDSVDVITYTQSKNGTVYLTQTFTLLGPTLTTAGNFTYYSGTTQTITGSPLIYNEDPATTSWTVTITPNKTSVFGTMSSLGSGGTTNFNSTTKVYTITGTKTQVNSHLNSLRFSSVLGQDLDFNLTYSFNSNLNQAASQIQYLNSNNYTYLDAVRSSDTYNLNTITTISGGPLITDSSNPSTSNYVLEVSSVPTNAISLIAISDPTYIRQFATSGLGVALDNDLTVIENKVYSTSTGSLVYTLNNPDPNGGIFAIIGYRIYNLFGRSAAINSDYIVLGSPNQYGDIGAGYDVSRVYIYSRSTGQYLRTITSSVSGGGDSFGISVKLSSTTLYIAAPGEGQGYVYAYDPATGSLLRTYANPNSGNASTGDLDNFGQSIDLSPNGNNLIIGAYGEDPSGSTDRGLAYLYNATNTSLIRTYTNPGSDPVEDEYGWSVAINNTFTAIGAPNEGTSITQKGKVYIYNNSTGTLVRTLSNPENIEDGRFGSGLAFNDNYLLVGAPGNNKTYMFDIYTGAIAYTFDGTLLGFNIALTNNYALVGDKLYAANVSESWNAATSTYTIASSKTLVNAKIDNLILTPATGYTNNFELYYKVTTPNSNTSTRNQFINKV